ncbi:MADS-box transcription factor 4 [Euphorbia peplus]|nr:MADS-box transcription factor 4 [Euphorbia peplus]
MGRGKIEIKKIENTSNRQVTFVKRKNGIIKKAGEISKLCDAEVSLMIISSSGKIHDNFFSPKADRVLPQLLEDYQNKMKNKLWDAEHENLKNEIDRIKKENDSMEVHLRHLKGLDIASMHYSELMDIERSLQQGLDGIYDQRMGVKRMMEENIEILEVENNRLICELEQMEMVAEEKVRVEMENQNPYHHHNPMNMPFAFRILKPTHPDLRERI